MNVHIEQIPYPLDADYYGESTHISELEAAAKKIVGEINAGEVLIYLFRRFGYPRFGWDGLKQLVMYRLTTPIPGVILLVEPAVTGAFTFGYLLRKDISESYSEEETKPHRNQYTRFETWTKETKGIETIHMYYEPDNEKLQRVWRKWVTSNKNTDFEDRTIAEKTFIDEQHKITETLLNEYTSEIEPFPNRTRLEDLPDDSIRKQCHIALCNAIKDLLSPVCVRDVMINIRGEVRRDEMECRKDGIVMYAAESGCGVGDRLAE